MVNGRIARTVYGVAMAGLMMASALPLSANPPRNKRMPAQDGDTVYLKPGTCPVVKQGDTLLIDVKPIFDPTTASVQVRRVDLLFVPDPTMGPLFGKNQHDRIVLSQGFNAPPDFTNDGFFRTEYTARVKGLADGGYRLAEVQVHAYVNGSGKIISAHSVAPEHGDLGDLFSDPSLSEYCIAVGGLNQAVPVAGRGVMVRPSPERKPE